MSCFQATLHCVLCVAIALSMLDFEDLIKRLVGQFTTCFGSSIKFWVYRLHHFRRARFVRFEWLKRSCSYAFSVLAKGGSSISSHLNIDRSLMRVTKITSKHHIDESFWSWVFLQPFCELFVSSNGRSWSLTKHTGKSLFTVHTPLHVFLSLRLCIFLFQIVEWRERCLSRQTRLSIFFSFSPLSFLCSFVNQLLKDAHFDSELLFSHSLLLNASHFDLL